MIGEEWPIQTFVVQHVGPAGQWFDFSVCNVDHREIPDDLKPRIAAAMPEDKPWRLLKRIAVEEILDEGGQAMIPCRQCGKPVEPARECYAIPTCYACLPPPPPLPVAKLGKEGKP